MVKKRNLKIDKVKTEEQIQVERFVKIIICILLSILIIYGITKIFVTKENKNNTKDITKGTIDYNKLIVGNIFNTKYIEYYVFVYDGNNKDAIYYSAIIDSYIAKKDAKKVFWIDLNNKLNEKFIADKNDIINASPEKISDLKFGTFTLLKIKDKKIIKYINDIEIAKKELAE